MHDYNVIFYEKPNGKVPVNEFMDSLDLKSRAKLSGFISILEEKGNAMREPYSKHLIDGIFKLRCQMGSDNYRILYFFYYKGEIVLTNGFIKKTQKTPLKEIMLARKYREDYIRRHAHEI